ncbi:hypothetical protein [Streptomyces achromogenes]|uniref:hypothetical protein n=1 Tax=Streptomyces achromogenes TaxID=67255 RepID=UPI0027D7AF7B|nr:hypothetical protein [Streptomyces achromogenes]
MKDAEQGPGRAGQYLIRGVVDEEALKLPGQLTRAGLLIPFKGRYDGSTEEVCRLLPSGCRCLANRRACGLRKSEVEQDLARVVGVVSRQHVDG